MTSGRGGGQGSPGGKGNVGGKRMGFLEAQIHRANGEHMPIYNNMIVSDDESSSEVRKQGNSREVRNNAGGRAVDRIPSGDGSGLNPERARGFGMQTASAKNNQSESPSLNDMRARQGAIVVKFMTFYKQKPRWDQIANFVYNNLCPTDDLRKSVKDVQLHPVKMLIFVRFCEDKFRDHIAAKLRSSEGIIWSEYKVKVKGYSLDAEVKFIRLLGVSPETDQVK